ncbi:hypothetical protein HanRHA438_Chr07g0288591 [Helianthus annuus]|nr:hypothetical protein HanRHA438_Chr07g0288591 [Helianthus annuus]
MLLRRQESGHCQMEVYEAREIYCGGQLCDLLKSYYGSILMCFDYSGTLSVELIRLALLGKCTVAWGKRLVLNPNFPYTVNYLIVFVVVLV